MADKDWRVTMQAQLSDGRLFDGTFCVRDHTSVPLADPVAADTVASTVSTWLATLWRATMSTDQTLSQILVNRGGPWGPGEGDPQESGSAIVNLAGTNSAMGGTTLPHGICGRITLYTALASRRGRGRIHLPWLKDSNQVVADTLYASGAYWIAGLAIASALQSGFDFSPGGISHHLSTRVHSHVDATTRDVSKAVLRPQVSYLRSRLTSP